jgi:hypothetical protein
VVLLSPPPDPHDVRACLARDLAPAQCARPISAFWGSYAYAEWQAARGRAQWVDPRPWFCLRNLCPPVVGDLPVTFDGKHVTGAYAARLAPVLSQALS